MGEDDHKPVEITGVEQNKKRKLQEDQLSLPSPKHKHRDRSCGADNESPITDEKKVEDSADESQNDEANDDLDPCESVMDSNSINEEFDTAMSAEAEVKPTFESGINYLDWPIISSTSSSLNNYKNNNNLYSPVSIDIKSGEHSVYAKNDIDFPNLGDELQFEQGFPCSEDHLNEHEMNYVDFICSENENNDQEQCSEVAAEEMTPYSNELTPNLYVLSSGRWIVNPDTRLGARKPTIDQEFEQYFSMLML